MSVFFEILIPGRQQKIDEIAQHFGRISVGVAPPC